MNNEIDYNTKIANFKTMADIEDEDTALKYLSDNNWDEMVFK